MKTISAAIACLLTASICFAGEDLSMWEEYGDTFVGTWQAEIRIDSDLPTGEQAGAIVQGEAEIEWILDKKAIVTVWRLGTLRGQTLEFWDPAEKCIRWNAVDSSGAFGGGTGVKTGPNRWIMKTQSMSPAGVRSSSTGDVTVSESGDTQSWINTDRREADKELPNITTVWKRVRN